MSELLPCQRPNLSLSLKYKRIHIIKALALHEASHAFVWIRHGETIEGLNMADKPPETYGGYIPTASFTRVLATVTLTDGTPRESNIPGDLAGAVANELCGMSDELSIEGDVQQAIGAALTVTADTRLTGKALSIDPTLPISCNATLECLRRAWRDAIDTVTDPQSFGAIHAIANAALKHTTLSAEEIGRLIETSEPFTSPALARRRNYVVAKSPAIWEPEFARQIAGQFSPLNWK